MKRPVIFDVDGVLADFIQSFTEIANRRNPSIEIKRQVDQLHWLEKEDFSGNDWFTVWDEIKLSLDFWSKLSPIANLEDFFRINTLSSSREVYFVTSRIGYNPKKQTEYWLRTQGVHNPTVVICNRKGEMARAVDAAWLIEDKAGNAVYTVYHSPNTKACLIDRPYNQFTHRTLGSKVTRFATVSDFLDVVEIDY